ncbi:hypothetical protein KW790_01535 [Candidatus Parcubacteria bacterium]|nr:hypothetical protein [Candidatus Parcubacteria bacterium]
MQRVPPFKVEWDAHEYEHRSRSGDWFWVMGIITVAVVIVSIILGNVIFAILILEAVFALSLFINRPPETVHVVVDEKGITKDHMRYPYSTLHSFWLEEHITHPKLLLRSHKFFMPMIIIPLGSTDPDRLHRTLSRLLPEHQLSTPFTERFLEYLGF